MADPWDQGWKASQRGEPQSANPHGEGTVERGRWLAGWTDHDEHSRSRDEALDSIGWFG